MIADALIQEFLCLRIDVASHRLGGASVGKFIEAYVMALEYLDSGTYTDPPSVDSFLRQVESRSSQLDEGLRLSASRVARAVYTIRNKRSIAHLGRIDPNILDLQFCFAAAQWLLTELLRNITTSSMEESAAVVEAITAPVGGLVGDYGAHRLVHADVTAQEEVLLLLHAAYPEGMMRGDIHKSMERRARSTVNAALSALWGQKLVFDADTRFRLTDAGLSAAAVIAARLALSSEGVQA